VDDVAFFAREQPHQVLVHALIRVRRRHHQQLHMALTVSHLWRIRS
jgi:hypothetical protein